VVLIRFPLPPLTFSIEVAPATHQILGFRIKSNNRTFSVICSVRFWALVLNNTISFAANVPLRALFFAECRAPRFAPFVISPLLEFSERPLLRSEIVIRPKSYKSPFRPESPPLGSPRQLAFADRDGVRAVFLYRYVCIFKWPALCFNSEQMMHPPKFVFLPPRLLYFASATNSFFFLARFFFRFYPSLLRTALFFPL